MKKKKEKNLFLSKILIYKGLWETTNYFFCMKKKRKKREETFSGVNTKLQEPYGNFHISFVVFHIRRDKYLQSIALLFLLEV